MRLWQSKPIWLNSDSFLPNNNVNPSISYYIYKVAFLYNKPKLLRRFSPQGFLFSEQESYPTLTRLPHKKFCVFFAGTPGNIACELYIAAAKSDVRKRCRHFAVPSPLGLLTPPAGCTTLPPFLRRELLLGGKTVCYF